MTDKQIESYVHDVVEAMYIGDLIQYTTDNLIEYYKNNRELAEEGVKEFYSNPIGGIIKIVHPQ